MGGIRPVPSTLLSPLTLLPLLLVRLTRPGDLTSSPAFEPFPLREGLPDLDLAIGLIDFIQSPKPYTITIEFLVTQPRNPDDNSQASSLFPTFHRFRDSTLNLESKNPELLSNSLGRFFVGFLFLVSNCAEDFSQSSETNSDNARHGSQESSYEHASHYGPPPSNRNGGCVRCPLHERRGESQGLFRRGHWRKACWTHHL
jgi:hypothetical protein